MREERNNQARQRKHRKKINLQSRRLCKYWFLQKTRHAYWFVASYPGRYFVASLYRGIYFSTTFPWKVFDTFNRYTPISPSALHLLHSAHNIDSNIMTLANWKEDSPLSAILLSYTIAIWHFDGWDGRPHFETSQSEIFSRLIFIFKISRSETISVDSDSIDKTRLVGISFSFLFNLNFN